MKQIIKIVAIYFMTVAIMTGALYAMDYFYPFENGLKILDAFIISMIGSACGIVSVLLIPKKIIKK